MTRYCGLWLGSGFTYLVGLGAGTPTHDLVLKTWRYYQSIMDRAVPDVGAAYWSLLGNNGIVDC